MLTKLIQFLAVPPQGWEFVSDSWQEVDGTDEHDRLIELRVKLRTLGENTETIELEFLLDPETQLPVSGRVLDGNDNKNQFAFAYPEQGPTTIFALGVPQETQVTSITDETVLLALDNKVEAVDETASDQPRAGPKKTSKVIDIAEGDVLLASPHELFSWEVPEQSLSDGELTNQINTLLSEYWQSQGVQQAKPANDEEFLRRVYLDLAGRIPMVSEVYAFLDDTLPDRRERLVDSLLGSYDYATHMASVWRTMLLPEGVDVRPLGGTAKFDAWLAEQFNQNLPYSEQASALLSAEGRVSESGPLLFYAALKLNPEELAAKTSRVFLASRMECAQCHDHPFDNEISQKDFWGFAAYFAQISRPKGKMEMTSRVLRVKDNTQGEVVLPDTDEVIAPSLPNYQRDESQVADQQDASRRHQLVTWAYRAR